MIGLKTRYADCRMLSKLYPTFLLPFIIFINWLLELGFPTISSLVMKELFIMVTCESDCRSRGREFDPGVPVYLAPWTACPLGAGCPRISCPPPWLSSPQAKSHIFVEIDYEIISMVILLTSAESFKKDCCQLQATVCAQSTGLLLVQACPGKVWLGELTAKPWP